jgi:hypothetical protein
MIGRNCKPATFENEWSSIPARTLETGQKINPLVPPRPGPQSRGTVPLGEGDKTFANNKNRELKDIPDIVHLMRMNTIDPNETRVRTLFQKYHLMELYDSVVHALKDWKWNE